MFITALFTIAKTWEQINVHPIDGGMNKEDVVQIHNGIILSHKKEWNNPTCSNMERPRDCYTEWSKSNREKQILYGITCRWNLKHLYK